MTEETKTYAIIAGTSTFVDYDRVCAELDNALSQSNPENVVIYLLLYHKRGADMLAHLYAKENNLAIEVFSCKSEKSYPEQIEEMIQILRDNGQGRLGVVCFGVDQNTREICSFCKSKNILYRLVK